MIGYFKISLPFGGFFFFLYHSTLLEFVFTRILIFWRTETVASQAGHAQCLSCNFVFSNNYKQTSEFLILLFI